MTAHTPEFDVGVDGFMQLALANSGCVFGGPAWMSFYVKFIGRSAATCLINALTGQVGPGTQVTGNRH